jgi:hypothetical protein
MRTEILKKGPRMPAERKNPSNPANPAGSSQQLPKPEDQTEIKSTSDSGKTGRELTAYHQTQILAERVPTRVIHTDLPVAIDILQANGIEDSLSRFDELEDYTTDSIILLLYHAITGFIFEAFAGKSGFRAIH